jgi:IclR family pca regulon transcriptional regulator
MTIALALGSRLPAYPTSMGRVLLAGLSDEDLGRYLAATSFDQLTPHTVTDPTRLRDIVQEVRENGYSLVDQELEEGVRSIAAPIKNGKGETIAAMNVSCHASRIDVDRMLDEFRPKLFDTATAISDRVGVLKV